MKFSLTIDMDNAAFDIEAEYELSRILFLVQQLLLLYDGTIPPRKRPLIDDNGNRIGSWEITS